MTQKFKINGKYFDKKTARLILVSFKRVLTFKFTYPIDKENPEMVNVSFGRGFWIRGAGTCRTVLSEGPHVDVAYFEYKVDNKDGESAVNLFNALIKQNIIPEISFK